MEEGIRLQDLESFFLAHEPPFEDHAIVYVEHESQTFPGPIRRIPDVLEKSLEVLCAAWLLQPPTSAKRVSLVMQLTEALRADAPWPGNSDELEAALSLSPPSIILSKPDERFLAYNGTVIQCDRKDPQALLGRDACGTNRLSVLFVCIDGFDWLGNPGVFHRKVVVGDETLPELYENLVPGIGQN